MDQRQSLADWIANRDNTPTATLAADSTPTSDASATPTLDPKNLDSLRDALLADLCTRLGLDADSVADSILKNLGAS